ncbi:hypothetical protein [Krasilnikovia sp. MM14-A1259]|uniref:hypothetical protein n=1 Tax=Krasilnikovia sp. MM14-A1259 TaxID=3373539 RepID=UPI0038183C91
MWKRMSAAGAGLVLAVGGWVAAGHWTQGRIAACEQRSAVLSTLEVLNRQPDSVRPDSPAFGCDQDRIVAYASRQFHAATGPTVDRLSDRVAGDVDHAAVTAFYRQALEGDKWRILARKATPGPDAASLCARKELPFGTVYLDVSFPFAGSYEVTAADTTGAGARCA